MQLHSPGGDNGSESLKLKRIYSLIISSLFFFAIPFFLNAQITNELAFERLVMLAGEEKEYLVDSLTGFTTPNLVAHFSRPSAAGVGLMIESPAVTFTRMGRDSFRRVIEVVITFQDSLEHSFSLVYSDTLSRKSLKQVRNTRYPELKGSNPLPTSKYLAPALLIGTAIAGIISLFYLRS